MVRQMYNQRTSWDCWRPWRPTQRGLNWNARRWNRLALARNEAKSSKCV